MHVQLHSAKAALQQESRQQHMKTVDSEQFLAHQRSGLRGRAVEDRNLEKWLSKGKHDYTSPKIQNDILDLFAKIIIREIVTLIRMLPLLQDFIIINGTQDLEGHDQEAM